MTILDRLAEHAQERVTEAKRKIPEAEIRRLAGQYPKGKISHEQM